MSDAVNELSSLRPYLLRAHHEWMSDNGLTPHLVVNAARPGVAVPAQFVKDGTIVLNIALRAVRDLALDNDAISFSARFSGVSHQIYVPIGAVRGLVAREYGVGVTFADEHTDDDNLVRGAGPLVAVDDTDERDPKAVEPKAVEPKAGEPKAGEPKAGEPGDGDPTDGGDGPPRPPGRGKRPSLRVVK